MKFFVVCVLASAYFAAPCYSEPFIMELPGYAKTVMGAYGNVLIVMPLQKNSELCIKFSSGNLSTSWYEPRRPFYSFRYFHYAAKPTYENRFLVASIECHREIF